MIRQRMIKSNTLTILNNWLSQLQQVSVIQYHVISIIIIKFTLEWEWLGGCEAIQLYYKIDRIIKITSEKLLRV